MNLCQSCKCEMHDFEPGPYCQLCELILVAGWGWIRKECPSLLECYADPDALCIKIGNIVAHAERLTYKNERQAKTLFCLALELDEERKKNDPPPSIHGDHI